MEQLISLKADLEKNPSQVSARRFYETCFELNSIFRDIYQDLVTSKSSPEILEEVGSESFAHLLDNVDEFLENIRHDSIEIADKKASRE